MPAHVPLIELIVAQNIRKVLRARGMTVTDLAEQTNISRETLSRTVSGRRRVHVHTLDVVAAALDVMPAALLGAVRIEIDTNPE